jgi:Bacterial antitoxin of type II TA system, VapB
MGEKRKITVEVPEDLLASAQAFTGKGVTSTVREGLRELVSIQAQREARKLRGKVKFSMTWQDLRDK